jgi:hypothetical protein
MPITLPFLIPHNPRDFIFDINEWQLGFHLVAMVGKLVQK